MRRVVRYETRDGLLHSSLDAAERHADKVYGDKLTNLAHHLLRQDKYTKMTEFLDANLSLFNELRELRADRILDELEEDAE